MVDLQKAGLWKRFAAWLFDGILSAVLAVGIAFLLSAMLGYDAYSAKVTSAYEKYESMYSVDFDISVEAYEALTSPEKEAYDAAYQALIADEEAVHAYNMTVNLSMIIVIASILASVMIWEFAIPLALKNGQTLGKKIFGICLMRTDSVKMNTLQLLVRTLLGKFTVETMIPVYGVLMIVFGTSNPVMLLISLVLLAVQLVVILATYTNSCIHDLLAGTVVVDASSQMIFETPEALLAYKKEAHAAHSREPSLEK